MKVSQLFGRTSKTEGSDLTIPSHRLLTQAGYIRESTAGRYFFLPLGQRVQNKVMSIVRKHMDRLGVQEVLLPTLHPIELWQETNRTSSVGFELMTVEDRRKAQFALGGTAEEMAVDVVRRFNLSYKDMPMHIYQFSMKFRDEMRARGGLLRVREFIMKDAYSFSTEEQFDQIYKTYWQAYQDIYDELGLKVDVVPADNGYIGGDYCHEFISESESGEGRYFVSEDGSYLAHEDIAKFTRYQEQSDEEMKPLQEVEGKGIIGVEELAKFLDIPVEKTTKTILFEDEKGRVIAAAVNGLYDINETKLLNVTGSHHLQLASPETVKRVTKAEVGYAGFLNLPKEVIVILDESLKGRKNFEVGANRTDYHSINANFGRDYPEPKEFYDIALAKDGYLAPDGKQKLVAKRGIEVGNIFQQGYHYSDLMKDASFVNKDGKRQKYYMGAYGLGICRTMAALVEASHDDKGIIWPKSVAPYLVYLAPVGSSKEVTESADEMYKSLTDSGIDVLYDDRTDVRPGEKFADADLIGIPYRVVVSEKTIQNKKFEFKKRSESEVQLLDKDEVIKIVLDKQS